MFISINSRLFLNGIANFNKYFIRLNNFIPFFSILSACKISGCMDIHAEIEDKSECVNNSLVLKSGKLLQFSQFLQLIRY